MMSRKIITRTLAVFLLLFVGIEKVAGLSLLDAIEQTGKKIAGELPKGSRVAIVAFESANGNISDFIMEELTGALFDRGIEVADRQNLEYVYKELKLQMSGDVSDESAKSIGKFLAADMVITGQLINIGNSYRYRTSAINVETAVRASVTRLDIKNDTATKRMITALTNQKTTVKVAKYGVSEDIKPQTAGTFLDRGIMFASKEEYDLAIKDFTEAIRLNPNLAVAYIERGVAFFFGKNDPNHAITDYNQALKLDPNSARAYAMRGIAYDKKEDFDRAISDYTQTIKLSPGAAPTYVSRGILYADMKNDWDRAFADFNQAIKVAPEYYGGYFGRAIYYKEKGDFDRAIADLTKTIQLNHNHYNAYFERGYIYYLKGNYDFAIADWEEVLRIIPNHLDARNNIEIARRQRGW
jgi:tetratricopeptide (TPR) repeat protein